MVVPLRGDTGSGRPRCVVGGDVAGERLIAGICRPVDNVVDDRPKSWCWSIPPTRTRLMVDDSTIEAFARDGVVVVRGALTHDELATLARGFRHVVDHPSERAVEASRSDDPGRFFEDFVRWSDTPEIEEIALRSKLPELAAALMDSNSATKPVGLP